MENEKTIKIEKEGSLVSYSIGFILSLILTFISFFLAFKNILKGEFLFLGLSILAILQASIQLFFFLHVGKEKAPYWKALVFLFMLSVTCIVVIGSLWIMYSLDYRMMEPK
ncbi:cytochrome o ubiquinol oxidase subunit IV [Criblamydia sequanensis]|uniref:Cytochrome bo(3) ubiquinol oxidase subunit 4 n=1 Tax=Candidatus Criblamydia sequanensis CRIB-18 TaxID=1437425 RepID=A0A090D3E4_9BACT|nr:cytochrome o ubiquinol oxidase subunit IV [Criblamydia sequanensis]CDR35238.1 Cytochrome o ubiquinol oxidase, subunit IV [Criblamydia sequanensis CRIB-18]